MLAPRKQTIMISPASFTNGATASGNVDTRGFDYVEIDLIMATADVVSNIPSVLKLSEADVTDVTSFANISGAVGGTDFTIAASTSVANGYKFCVDLRGRKRYIKLSVSPRTTQISGAVANLGRGEEQPIGTTSANVQNLVAI